jgi:hypothetical protein
MLLVLVSSFTTSLEISCFSGLSGFLPDKFPRFLAFGFPSVPFPAITFDAMMIPEISPPFFHHHTNNKYNKMPLFIVSLHLKK